MDVPLGPGRVIWAVYPGERGDGKMRPMIVATRRTDILKTGLLVAVVCSTDFREPPTEGLEVLLPSDPEGHSASGLRRPTVAVCDWVAELPVDDVAETGGTIPISLLREICGLAGISYTPER